jgi:formylglycine-generating enzyme required for sulfatase activity
MRRRASILTLVSVAVLIAIPVAVAAQQPRPPKALRKALDLLDALRNVDGTGSGLDADRLQGMEPKDLMDDVATLVTAQAYQSVVRCAPDAVRVGDVCVDKFEASVWEIPPANAALAEQVKNGTATAESLEAGAVQLGCAAEHAAYDLGAFPADGNWSSASSPNVYAASIADVLPTACTTWFQAEQACALSGKRLLTNQEWQRAAAGTPACAAGTHPTGSDEVCVSSWGTFDMVGNASEWVADWVLLVTAGAADEWNAVIRGAASPDEEPGSRDLPASEGPSLGFRCVR